MRNVGGGGRRGGGGGEGLGRRGVVHMMYVFSHTASKGFWAQALGVGDFYYEVRS